MSKASNHTEEKKNLVHRKIVKYVKFESPAGQPGD